MAQNAAGWAAQLKEWGNGESDVQWKRNQRKREGKLPVRVRAGVLKPWRKAQCLGSHLAGGKFGGGG